MSQITTGLRSILSWPPVYNFVQMIFGGKKSREYFITQHLKPQSGERILDIGCGPASLLPFLPPDIEYVGYDPSAAYIETAKQNFGDRGQFYATLFSENEARRHQPFDLVILSAVLHHMSDEEATSLFALIHSVLKPDGRVVSIDCTYIDGQNPVARMLISMDRGQHVRTPESYRNLALTTFEKAEGTINHSISFLPYTRWYMHCSS